MLKLLTPVWQVRFEGNDLTPSKVAELAGLTKSYVISIMKGHIEKPDPDNLRAIEAVFTRVCPTCRRYWPEKDHANAVVRGRKK